MKICIAQINYCVGDVVGNCERIQDIYRQANSNGANIVIFSEMSVTGYPADDLLCRSSFRAKTINAIDALSRITNHNTIMIVGGVYMHDSCLYNAAFVMQDGAIQNVVTKSTLSYRDVFDEYRTLKKGHNNNPILIDGIRINLRICEDIWRGDPPEENYDITIAMNASPYYDGRLQERFNRVKEYCLKSSRPLIYVNQVGGQDELVFDGGSFIANKSGSVVSILPEFEEAIEYSEWQKINGDMRCMDGIYIESENSIATRYHALILSLQDYIHKNDISGVLVGVSGGIDSALCTTLAVDALGQNKVRAVMMPSQYTTEDSKNDAQNLIKNLNIQHDIIAIDTIYDRYLESLRDVFRYHKADITEENLQARIRGDLLMALSNKTGYLVLSTGNKSELATGYSTIYGDMCGGFSPLKDVYKTSVYELSVYRNVIIPQYSISQDVIEPIPVNILKKAPSAELRHNQKDSDTLPPYNVLDNILKNLIEDSMSVDNISIHNKDLVRKIANMIKRAEFKRSQAPVGPKLTKLSFGREWRYPITSRSEM